MHQPHTQIDPAVMFWIALISLIYYYIYYRIRYLLN